MKLFIVDSESQIHRLIKEHKPISYDISRKIGIMTDRSEFMFVLKLHNWIYQIHGYEFSSYENLSWISLTETEEEFMKSCLR